MEKIRTCVAAGCSNKFRSPGPGHRICPKCKANQEWLVAQWGRDESPPGGWDPVEHDEELYYTKGDGE